jgi:hypothetical protein
MATRWLMAVMLTATTMWLGMEVALEGTLPLRFAIQGDLHNFRRVPESYLRRMLKDAKEIGCAFVAFLGDIFNGTKENPMRLSKESPLPLLWQKGDHEFFGEWGRIGAVRLSQRHPLAGEVPDPLVFFRGALPRFEALTGQPTTWAFTLKGILFVVTHNGKNHVWHDWQLSWLRQLLTEHRHRTTVLLSHRTLDELGERAEALRKLLNEFPQVILFCDAHIHNPHPFRLIGNSLQVGAEGNNRDDGKLTYEGDWYVVVEIAKDALRIFRRRIATGELILLHERKTETTLNETETGKVHLAFVMSDKSVRFNPALWLRRAKLRVWGIAQEQQLPLPDENETSWQKGDGVSLQVVAGDSEWQRLGIGKVFQATVNAADKEVTIAEITTPVHFETDPTKVGIAGTLSHGTQVIPLFLAKAPKDVRLRLEVEALRSDGTMESRHWVEGARDGSVLALQAATGHIYLGTQTIFASLTKPYWRWEGVDGKTEVDGVPQPRQATQLRLRLKAIGASKGATVQFVGFVFPETGGFFTPVPQGRFATRRAVVRVGGRRFELGDLDACAFREVDVGELAGGEPFTLSCDGNKLALVEWVGEAEGLMCHLLRRVQKVDGDEVHWGDETELSKSFAFYGWMADVWGTCLWRLRKGTWEFLPTR